MDRKNQTLLRASRGLSSNPVWSTSLSSYRRGNQCSKRLSRAEAAAERIRFDVAKDPIKYQEDIEVPVTITIGISPYVAGTTIKKMMEDADAKLYVGKHNGKNQVVSSLE